MEKDNISNKNKFNSEKKLFVLGKGYYINEQDHWVFTAEYHLKRGYCCNNGCKHCPYNL